MASHAATNGGPSCLNTAPRRSFFWHFLLLTFSISLLATAALSQETNDLHKGLKIPAGIQKMYHEQSQLALRITFLAAFLAGLISFLSPCGFVLLPAYFSIAFQDTGRPVKMAASFSAGLVAAFSLVGLIAGIAGSIFNPYRTHLALIGGIGLAVVGALMLAGKTIPGLNLGSNPPGSRSKTSRTTWGMACAGFLFALGWTPCIGAILGGIFILATGLGSIAASWLLMIVYAIGVVVPFLIATGVSKKYHLIQPFQQRTCVLPWTRISLYHLLSGILLVVIGVFMIWGRGTTSIEGLVTAYTPWRMTWFVEANEFLNANSLLQSSTAHILGALLAIGITFYIFTKWRE